MALAVRSLSTDGDETEADGTAERACNASVMDSVGVAIADADQEDNTLTLLNGCERQDIIRLTKGERSTAAGADDDDDDDDVVVASPVPAVAVTTGSTLNLDNSNMRGYKLG